MKGSEAKLVSLMQGSDKRFVIPVYQRNYDWRMENCKQLFNDLVKIIEKDRKSHFFGSIVSVHTDSAYYNEFLIIDGQQRLTTISLLFLAMYNLMKSGKVVPTQKNLADKIYKTYLIDEWQEDETRIKLKPVKNDRAAFGRLFGEEEDYIPQSNLTINYHFFCDQILLGRITVDDLYTAITRLEIINITLNQDDNPQLIFESLNSTGLALSEGDKIRNFVLMGLPTKIQDVFYEKYWNKIEEYTDYDVSAFVRAYLSVKEKSIPTISRVYVTFKEYVEDKEIDTEVLLKDMKAYAKRYWTLLHGHTENAALNGCIERLNRLETTVTRPFFLEVLRLLEMGDLTLLQVRDIFLCTENYLFRRTICNLPTNTLNKTFLMLHWEILRFDGTTENYVEKFKYALLAKSDRIKFPRDNEFIEALSTRQVYQMNAKNKIYILERFENGTILEDKDIYHHCDEGIYSIEHIMPQHLTPAWTKALGSEYEEIHEVWLHRLANLTLTAYNAKYSNNTFEDKREREDGFRSSGLRLNMWVAEQSRWTLAELELRNEMLMSRALEIWPLPETTYHPAEKQLDCYTLEDDVDLSGREIQSYEYKHIIRPVSSWIAMQEQVQKILHEGDKSVLMMLAHDNDPENELSPYVSTMPGNLRSAMFIDDGIYMERNTSTSTKISILRKFFKAYGENPEDLVFYLRDSAEVKSDEYSEYHEIRHKYWTYALPRIQEAHQGGAFANVHATKENWCTGVFGIGGFNLACIANQNQARIDLTLAKYDKAKNKSAFDYLYAHKAELEQQLGTAVEWQRSEETKASYIVYRMRGVSVTNEADWERMAQFHAEWSKKIYDAFVPLLREWSEHE